MQSITTLTREEARGLEVVDGNNIMVDVTKGIQYLDETMELLIDSNCTLYFVFPARETYNSLPFLRTPLKTLPTAISPAMWTLVEMLPEP